MYNCVILVGRVCNELEMRYSPKGKAFVRFTLAVDRTYRNNEKEYETDFIHCIVWGKQAELFAQYQGKGNLIQLQGKLQINKYEKNGAITIQRLFAIHCWEKTGKMISVKGRTLSPPFSIVKIKMRSQGAKKNILQDTRIFRLFLDYAHQPKIPKMLTNLTKAGQPDTKYDTSVRVKILTRRSTK